MADAKVTDETITAAQGGDRDAMWQIVSAYESLLMSAVKSVAPTAKPEQVDDLLQEARAILIQHVHAFKTGSSSAQLSTFAHRAVRRGVAFEWVRMTTGLTIEPAAALDVRRALHQTEGNVEDAWLIVSAAADPRRRMSRGTFTAIMEALSDVDTFDAPAHPGGSVVQDYGSGAALTLADTIPDPGTDLTDPAERRDLAHFLLGQLVKRQAFALRAHYGIGMTALTDDETALDLQISKTRVRTLRKDGINSCRRVAVLHSIAA
ncbi:helix-turn-helix domain-containing protein [Streptomyces sp. NPDC056508]|uniref:helix-turn-helix domain-containing protein n=1 Tax=Streptomyces sp. NPDC056508 TaxID=3345845 RepID=UPI0036A3A934